MTMTRITITLDTQNDDATWGDVLDAAAHCTPTNQDLPVNGEWSGDVDAYSAGFRVRVVVAEAEPEAAAEAQPDAVAALDAFMDAVSDVRDLFIRVELQKGILADAEKAGDMDQAAFSRTRIERHTVNLVEAQARLERTQAAYKASKA